MDISPFVEASFYLLLRVDRSFVAENGQNGHILKFLRLNQCCERGEGVYQTRRLQGEMTINDHLVISITAFCERADPCAGALLREMKNPAHRRGLLSGLKRIVGPDGLEPSTHGLKVRCSTD